MTRAVVSLIATIFVVAMAVVGLVAGGMSPSLESRTSGAELAVAVVILFGAVWAVREWKSRRALQQAQQELRLIREQLAQQEKLAAAGQRISGVAHQLSNPLQAILGFTELLLAGKHTAFENEELRAIRDNATKAAGVVRSLMTSETAAAPFAVMPRPEDALDQTPRRRTALVVDDEESNAALVRRVLAQRRLRRREHDPVAAGARHDRADGLRRGDLRREDAGTGRPGTLRPRVPDAS